MKDNNDIAQVAKMIQKQAEVQAIHAVTGYKFEDIKQVTENIYQNGTEYFCVMNHGELSMEYRFNPKGFRRVWQYLGLDYCNYVFRLN